METENGVPLAQQVVYNSQFDFVGETKADADAIKLGISQARSQLRFETVKDQNGVEDLKYISTEKIDRGVRRPKKIDFSSLPRKAFPLGFGQLFGQDPLARSPSRSGLGHFSVQDGPRPPTEAPRAAKSFRGKNAHAHAHAPKKSGQERPQSGQERPKSGPELPRAGPRPPT